MAKNEVKLDVDGQDFLEFERDSAEEAYEAFLEENENEFDAPIVVWLGLEKVATFKRHIGGSDVVGERKPKSKKTTETELQESIGTLCFSVSALQKNGEDLTNTGKQIRLMKTGTCFGKNLVPYIV
jgi:hypothetical protein